MPFFVVSASMRTSGYESLPPITTASRASYTRPPTAMARPSMCAPGLRNTLPSSTRTSPCTVLHRRVAAHHHHRRREHAVLEQPRVPFLVARHIRMRERVRDHRPGRNGCGVPDVDTFVRLLGGERRARDQQECDETSQHPASVRKFFRSCFPCWVSTDSGWNCTPHTGCSTWRTAWISVSSSLDVASISSDSGRVARSTINEWYRITSNGDGSPAKSPVPSCTMRDILPCITRAARTTRPPYASPMAWWPRHTPSVGITGPQRETTGTVIPASCGVHGPGDSTMAFGASAPTSSTVIASFRLTTGSAPISPRYWTRL